MVSLPITNMVPRGILGLPNEANVGQVSIPAVIDCTAAFDWTADFSLITDAAKWNKPRSVFVNNRLNPAEMFVEVSGTDQKFPIPPYSAGFYTIIAQPQSKIRFYGAGGATGPVDLDFLNWDVEPYTYFGFAPLVDGAKVYVYGEDGVTPMSRTNPFISTPQTANPTKSFITLVAGVSTEIVPANAQGRQVRFRNIGDAAGAQYDAYYNVGAAAIAARASSFLLPANGQWETLMSKTTQAVNVIADGNNIIEVQYNG